MIRSFKNRDTETLFSGRSVKTLPPEIQKRAYRKLRMIHRARKVIDLTTPPGNRLEALRDDREGQYSIRINDQWRICFAWKDENAYEVEIVDYHS